MTPGISQPNTTAPTASGDWLAHTWRLVSWNLTLARRRLMGKLLLGIFLLGFFALIGIFLLGYAVAGGAETSSTTFCSPTPAAVNQPPPGGSQSCDTSSQQAQQGQQVVAQFLTFPMVLEVASGYLSFMGVILFCVLAGGQVGNEYNQGTHRLALSRGASRAQLLAAQIGAFAILALVMSLLIIILDALVGVSLGPLLGGSIPGIPAASWGEILGFWLILALKLFTYTLIALLLATAGRSSAAGIAGSLGYVMFENIALTIILLLAAGLTGDNSSVAHLQDFFVGPNLSAALMGVSQSPIDLGGASSNSIGTIAPFQGLIVSILYCCAFISLSYLIMRKRDVTH